VLLIIIEGQVSLGDLFKQGSTLRSAGIKNRQLDWKEESIHAKDD
jgi:hypothetical protein